MPGDPEQEPAHRSRPADRRSEDAQERQKLDEQQIADLVAWVKMGAPWDPNEAAEPLAICVSSAAAASSVGEEFFETKVRPIFANVCSECHGDKATSGLQVFSRESLLLRRKARPRDRSQRSGKEPDDSGGPSDRRV